MIHLAAAVVGVLAGATDRGVLRVVVMDLSVVELPAAKAAVYTEHLAGRLVEAGADVVTSKGMAAVLGLERQRQLLGCDDGEPSCLAELAAAMGTDAVATGEVARVGVSLQLNLRLVSAKDSSTLATHSARVESEEELMDALASAASTLAGRGAASLSRALTPTVAPASVAKSSSTLALPAVGWAAVAVGGAAAAVGVGLLIQAGAVYGQIPQTVDAPARPRSEVEALVNGGKALQAGGWACTVGGALVAVVGATMLVAGRRAPGVAMGVAVGADGMVFALAGRF